MRKRRDHRFGPTHVTLRHPEAEVSADAPIARFLLMSNRERAALLRQTREGDVRHSGPEPSLSD